MANPNDWKKINRERWNKYQRERTERIEIRLTPKKDKDVIDMLKKQPSISGYLKKLVRADLENKKEIFERTKNDF